MFIASNRRSAEGVTMLEVLVAIFILTLGLLGTAAMQSQMQATRSRPINAQAIVLLQDMVDRVNSNRKNVSAYVTGSPLGTSSQDCAR